MKTNILVLAVLLFCASCKPLFNLKSKQPECGTAVYFKDYNLMINVSNENSWMRLGEVKTYKINDSISIELKLLDCNGTAKIKKYIDGKFKHKEIYKSPDKLDFGLQLFDSTLNGYVDYSLDYAIPILVNREY